MSADFKLREIMFDAFVVNVEGSEDNLVKLEAVCVKDSLESVKLSEFLKKEYQSYLLRADEPEAQTFLRSTKFAEFVKESIFLSDVVLFPSLGDIVKFPSSPITVEVVGSSEDAKEMSKLINNFLDRKVICCMEVVLRNFAHGQFLQEFCVDELDQIEEEHFSHRAKIIFIKGRSDYLVLQAARVGISSLQRDIDKLTLKAQLENLKNPDLVAIWKVKTLLGKKVAFRMNIRFWSTLVLKMRTTIRCCLN
eukprot:m.85852 g.85852  ORF g.85852 m.85852 type:complete len:250 (+) comp36483_c0_seq3:1585-2334(+)